MLESRTHPRRDRRAAASRIPGVQGRGGGLRFNRSPNQAAPWIFHTYFGASLARIPCIHFENSTVFSSTIYFQNTFLQDSNFQLFPGRGGRGRPLPLPVGPGSLRGGGRTKNGGLRSVLIVSIRRHSNGGSQIPEPLLIVNSQCPLKVRIVQGLGPFFQIELFKTVRT